MKVASSVRVRWSARAGLFVVLGLVAGLLPASAVSAVSSNALGWGFNAVGQVGSGSGLQAHLSAVAVAGGHQFTKVVAGQTHMLGSKADGSVWIWGDKDPIHYAPAAFIQAHDPVPVQVQGLAGVIAMAAGADSNLAIRSDGTTWAWGANEAGQLCDGSRVHRLTPVQVPLTGVVGVATSGRHSLLLRQDGSVWACGDNSRGQLGDGTLTGRLSPVRVSGLTGVVEVSTGSFYSLARRSDGGVWGWGENGDGQLAAGSFFPHRATAAALSGLSNVTSISAGLQHGLALLGNGQVKAWGHNFNGQLCDGGSANRALPVTVPGIPLAAVQVSAGRFASAVRVGGSVYICGRNNMGQLGDGTTTNRHTPGLVPGLGNVEQVSVGGSHAVVIVSP